MDTTTVRASIPESWGSQALCPWCSAPKMAVCHTPDAPDQLACGTCGLAFELELGGGRLRVAHWPEPLDALQNESADQWLTTTKLRELARQAPSRPDTRVPISPPKVVQVQPASLDEMVVRIKKLRDLGNSPTQIRNILAQTGAKPEQIKAALEAAKRVERQESSRQQKKMWRSLAFVGITLLACIGAGITLQHIYAGKSGGVPPLRATLMPGLAEALNLNTPMVQYGAAPAGPISNNCPRTSSQAAALFGGQADAWSSPPNSNGWVMIDPGQANTLYIPQGMKAAYLELGSTIILVEISGPATLSNVYYIAVSCP